MIEKLNFKNLEQYLKEIEKFPLLDKEEEIKLQKNSSSSNQDMQKLYNSNLRLVVNIAEKLSKYGVETEELINLGNDALEKAIETFNQKVNTNLLPSSYYIWWIKFEIISHIIKYKFTGLSAVITNSLQNGKHNEYLEFFFLKRLLTNLIFEKEGKSEDSARILENSLTQTFSDHDLNGRIDLSNFLFKIPEFKEILENNGIKIQPK